MDLSSKDYSLNFRGFEQNDPETVQRFTAFCEANFALSPEVFHPTQEHPLEVVLAQGESSEELEALARVLREIGARVDVSQSSHIEGGLPFDPPSTQDLHRLFRQHNDDGSNNASAPSCPYPPLGRTLYLLTQSDGTFDRRRIRSNQYGGDSPQQTPRSTLTGNRALLVLSVTSLCVGLLALLAVAFLVAKTPVLSSHERVYRSSVSSRIQSEQLKGEARMPEGTSPKTLRAHSRLGDFNVELKVLASPGALSVSSLAFTPLARTLMTDGAIVKRAVGDPTFLAESSPGTWKGPLIISIFVDKDGAESHFTIPALVTVSVNSDHTLGRAFVEIRDEVSGSSSTATTQAPEMADRLRALVVTDLSLS